MKRCLKITVCILMFLSISVHSFGKSDKSSELEIKLQELYSQLPEDITNVVTGNEYISLGEFFTPDNLISLMKNGIVTAFSRNNYSVFLDLFIFIIIGEVINKSLNPTMAKLSDFSILLIGGLSIFELLNSLSVSFIEKYSQISSYSFSVATLAITSMTSSVSSASAASLGSVCAILFSVFNFICSSCIVPFVNIYLCLNLSGSIMEDFNLLRVSSFLRNTSISIISIVLFLFSCIMSVQSSISMAEDSLLKKGLKQILTSGLPVLGGSVSDGLDTFFTSVIGIKNSVGILGITSTVAMSLSPIIELFVCFLFLSVTCFILSFFEGVSLYDFILSARDIISVMLCITLSLSIMIVLMFYFIIKVV